MARQTTDNLYIELGYFTPEEYYTYEAIASAANAVVASLSADVGVIRQGDSSQSVVASITATISNIKGVDIVLAPFASVTADAVVTRDAVSSQSSSAAQTTSSDRLRDFAISLSGAFAFAVIADGGNVQNASASISSAFTQTATGNLLADIISTQTSAVTQTATATVTRDLSSSQTVTASQSTIGGVIYEQASAISDAFNATMTVNVIVNPFATLETAAMMTTDFIVNRAATITLATIGNLNAQAIRSAGLTSSISAVASQTTQANRTANLVSTQTSAFTQTITFNKIHSAASTLTSAATMSISAVRVTRQPMIWQLGSDGELQTGVKKFGTGALGLKSTATISNNNYIIAETASPYKTFSFGSNDFTVDFWRYQTANVGSTYVNILTLGNADINIRLLHNYDGTNSKFRLQYTNTSDATITATGSNTTLTLNAWNHFRIVGQQFSSQTTNVAVWVNGTQVVTQTASNFKQGSEASIILRALGDYSTRQTYVDEFRLYSDNLTDISTTTFTAPTAAFTNDSSTQALLHFDGNLLDDNVTVLRTGASTISAVASISASTQKVISAASSQSSAVTLSSTATRIRTALANLAANGFVVTVAGYLQDDVADLNSAFTQTTQANYTVSANSTQTSASSLTAVGGYLKTAESQPFVEFHVDADINAVRGFDIALNSAFAQSADAQRLRGVAAQLAAEGFTVTIAGEQQNVQATLASAFAVTANLGIVKEFSSTQNSSSTLTANAGLSADITATISSTVAQTASADRIRLGTSTQTVTATQNTVGNVVTDILSTQNTVASQTSAVNFTADSVTFMVVGVDQTAVINRQASALSTQSALAQQTAQGNYTASGSINGTAVGFVIAVSAYTSTTNSDMHSAFTMTVSANYTIDQSSTQTSAFAQTTTGLRIKQYEGATISGIECDQQFRYVDNALNTAPNLYIGQGAVINIWARKATGASTSGGLIWQSTDSPLNYLILDYINSTTVRLAGSTFNGITGVNGWTWSSSSPADTLWHNYLILIRDQYDPGGGAILRRRAQLWVDGVNRGIQEISSTQTFEIHSPIWLGRGNTYNATQSTDFVGDLAQIWIGKVSDYTRFDPSLFYDNGYVELGSTGTAGGLLPTPYVYDAMDEPFSGKFIASSPDTITRAQVALPAPDMVVNAAMSAEAQNILVVGSTMSVTTAVTASLTGTFLAQITANAVSSLSAVTRVNKTFVIPLQVACTQTAQATAVVENAANLNSAVSQTTQADTVTGSVINLSAQATVLAVTGVLGSGSANLVSTALVTCTADRIKDVFMGVDSAMSVSATANYTASITVNQASTAALNSTADKIRGTQIDLLSDFALSTQATKTVAITSTQSAVFTQTAQPTQIKGTSANFAAITAVLTVGDVLQLDPYLTYVVEPETRYYRINRESRLYTIEAETREFIIQGYNL